MSRRAIQEPHYSLLPVLTLSLVPHGFFNLNFDPLVQTLYFSYIFFNALNRYFYLGFRKNPPIFVCIFNAFVELIWEPTLLRIKIGNDQKVLEKRAFVNNQNFYISRVVISCATGNSSRVFCPDLFISHYATTIFLLLKPCKTHHWQKITEEKTCYAFTLVYPSNN